MSLRTLFIGDLHYGPKNLKDHEVLAKAIHAAIDQYAIRCPRDPPKSQRNKRDDTSVVAPSPTKPAEGRAAPPLDLLVCLGDEIDKHDAGADVRGACVSFLRSLAARTRHMIVLVGNHTRKNNRVSTGPDHTLAELRLPGSDNGGIPGRIHIVEDPEILEIDGVRFGALPYIDPSAFTEVLREYCPELLMGAENLAFVIGHQEISGAQLMPGRESTCEAHWPNEWPPLISGHIHERHHIRNILYTGTPMQHSLSEGPRKYIHFGTLYAKLKNSTAPPNGGVVSETPAGSPRNLTDHLLAAEIGDAPSLGGPEAGTTTSAAWAYLPPDQSSPLPSNRYISSAGTLYEYRLIDIPTRSRLVIEISDAAAVLSYVDQQPQNYFSIRIMYDHASDLLASTSYAALMQRPRLKVSTEKRQTQTAAAQDAPYATATVENYASCLRRACADRQDIAALLAHIGGWTHSVESRAA
jgi:hypothetical protein